MFFDQAFENLAGFRQRRHGFLVVSGINLDRRDVSISHPLANLVFGHHWVLAHESIPDLDRVFVNQEGFFGIADVVGELG